MECNHECEDLAEVAKQELEDGVGDLGGEEHVLPDPGDAGNGGHEDVTGPDEGHGRDVPALCDQHSHPAHPAEIWEGCVVAKVNNQLPRYRFDVVYLYNIVI